MIDQKMKEAIEQIFQANISHGNMKLDVNKICSFLTNTLGTKVDKSSFVGCLDQLDIPASAEGDVVSISKPGDMEELNDEVAPEDMGETLHDTAVDQAAKDMFECKHLFKSVSDVYTQLKPHTRFNSRIVRLVEDTSAEYLLDKTVKKMKYNYIFESFKILDKNGKADLENGKMRCLVENTCLRVDLPIKSLVISKK